MNYTNSIFISFKDYQMIMANLRKVSEDGSKDIIRNKLCLIPQETNKLVFIATNGYIYAEHELSFYNKNDYNFNPNLYDKKFVIDIPPAIRLPLSSNVEINFNVSKNDRIKFIFSGGLTLEPLNYMNYKQEANAFPVIRKSINEQRNTKISSKNMKEVIYNSQYFKRLLTGIDGKIYFEELPILSGYQPMVMRCINRDKTISSTLAILPIRVSDSNWLEKEFNYSNIYPVIKRFEKEEGFLNG